VKVFFLDTSAVVRLYAVESGWRWIHNLVRSARAGSPTVRVAFCDLALPETVSALRQMLQKPDAAQRGLSRAAFRQAVPRLRADLLQASPLIAIPASGCIPLAAEVVERQEIRGADAVHLAAALTARDTLGHALPFAFVSHDLRQCRAAEREGLEVITPT
jgi:predicted nucleic acid-binding protein